MYGLVNQGLEQMLRRDFGDDAWYAIKQEAGVSNEFFVSHDSYPDEVTYALVAAASRYTGADSNALLESFGVFWVTVTAPEGYGVLMDAGGRTLREFFQNLPALHTRVGMSFPALQPPRFASRTLDSRRMELCYWSHRAGLVPFVVGLIRGLALRFGETVSIESGGEAEQGGHRFIIVWSASSST